MVIKHFNERRLPLVSVESLMHDETFVKHAISLSDIAADNSEQYLVVKVPASVDMSAFWVALKNAVNKASINTSSSNKAQKASTDPIAGAVATNTSESFETRNNNKINKLKDSILHESPWLLAREVSEGAGSGLTVKNPSAVPNRWKQSKKIFAIPVDGKDLYPAYALDEGGQPLPVVKKILQIFDNTKTPWALAFWFGTANSWLGSQKPKDLLTVKPDIVITAATQDKEGAIHG